MATHGSTAYHEAGHAIACWRQGIRVKRITIRPDEGTAGACTHEKYLRRSIEWDDSDHSRLKIERMIIVCLAGNEAQRLWKPQSIRGYQASSDYQQAVDLVFRVNGDTAQANVHLKWLQMRTTGLLKAHWSFVAALAADLLKEKTIIVPPRPKSLSEALTRSHFWRV